MRMSRSWSYVIAAVMALLYGSVVQADVATFNAPDMDQWAYHRLSGPQAGDYEDAALFTKHGIAGSDEDRAAIYLVGYSLGDQVPTGLGASNYQIESARLIAQVAQTNGSVVHDPTYDSYKSSLDSEHADYVPDADSGLPITLFGLGLQNGYGYLSFDTSASKPAYHEDSPPVDSAPPFPDRNAYPADFDGSGALRDVSNNVYDGFEANPWAVATIDGKEAGDLIAFADDLLFDLDVSNPDIQGYLQNALNDGTLGLIATSLHQTGSDGFIRLTTNETGASSTPARLELTYSLIPEPASLGLLTLGGLCVLRRRRTR